MRASVHHKEAKRCHPEAKGIVRLSLVTSLAPPQAEVDELARRARVFPRVAKKELLGGMTCATWKRMHADEVPRLEAAWAMVEANAELQFADALVAFDAGETAQQWLERKARVRRRESERSASRALQLARTTVPAKPVEDFLAKLSGAEVVVMTGERTTVDRLRAVERLAVELVDHGRVEKLDIIALARPGAWEAAGVGRDEELVARPAEVARDPLARPVKDGRPFMRLLGAPVVVALRNGLRIKLPVRGVGPFDVLLGLRAAEILVPLHAMRWWKRE